MTRKEKYGRKCQPGCACRRHKAKGGSKKCEPGCTCAKHDTYSVITMGRKCCRACRHWRYLHDFHGKWKKDGELDRIDTYCISCRKRFRSKHRKLKKASPHLSFSVVADVSAPYIPYAKRSPEQRRAWRRNWWNHKMKTDPEFADRWRESQRLYAWEKRRREGAKERGVNTSVVDSTSERVPFEPFSKWLHEMLVKYENNVNELSRVVGIKERRLRSLLSGKQSSGTKNGSSALMDIRTVDLDIVDSALLNEGSTELWEIYPELYS